MSKITIVSRPDQHLLIDVGGCLSFKEAIEQLSAALLSASQFWQGTAVDLNLGKLLLTKTQLAQIMALTKGVGISAKHIYAENPETAAALKEMDVWLEAAANENVSPAQSDEYNEHIKTTDSSHDESPPVNPDNATVEGVIMFEGQSQGCDLVTCSDILPAKSEPSSQQQGNIAEEHKVSSTSKKQSLYIKQTLRAGQAVSHEGDLIIIGDVNAGAEVLAEGDITIWGSLRGIAHAGVGGNTKAEIRALRLQPIQLRIAHYIARSPDAMLTGSSILSVSPYLAETAKLVDGKIRILRETFD